MRKMNDDIWMILAALSIGVLIWSMAVLGAVLEDLTLLGSEYYGTAEPPVRCGESHLSGLTEPPHFVY